MSEEYISPLKEELDLDTERFGTDIIVAHDEKNKRLLIDVPIGKRRKISSSGKSMLVANGKFNVVKAKGNLVVTVNAYDDEFSKAEIPKVKEFLAVKKQQAEDKKALSDLQTI